MTSLTIGQVSAVIAFAVFVLHLILPSAVSLVLVGALKDVHSTVTWSVVQRNLLGSLWPSLLRSDSAANRGVDPAARFITYARPIGAALISIAAVVTPLGLHDAISAERNSNIVPFKHVEDSSAFGYGSLTRPSGPWTRDCSRLYKANPCPGSATQITTVYNGTDSSDELGYQITNIDVNVPQNLVDLYTSGMSDLPPTVAGFFDIQSRTYSYGNDSTHNNNTKYLVDYFSLVESIILHDAIEPIHGLIVNTISGGVGFRNHSIPLDVELGAEWTEDILFIEPETACVNNNVSFEFSIKQFGGGHSAVDNLTLVDNGGFVDLVREYPATDFADAQSNPQLSNRAYKAAWITNLYAMLYMNVTRPAPRSFSYLNSQHGKHFPLIPDQGVGASASGISVDSTFLNMVNPNGSQFANYTLAQYPGSNYSNPFGISSGNYSAINVLCQGAGRADYANSSNIHVECGLVFGAAVPLDGPPKLVSDPYTRYTQPIYSCASANKASIKQVSFKYNATSGFNLKSLAITDVRDKVYPDNASMPLWGIEESELTLAELSQLWGFISPDRATSVNLTTFRAPSIRLPGHHALSAFAQGLGAQYFTGTLGPSYALGAAYSSVGGAYDTSFDWTGTNSLAMFRKWQNHSTSSDTIPTILNLIWTDMAANLMQGSKDWQPQPTKVVKRDGAVPDTVLVAVNQFRRRIAYRWVYSIPAFLTLGFVGLILCVSALYVVIGKAGPGKMQYYINNLSAGRLIGARQYPGACDINSSTKEWIDRVGRHPSTHRPHQPVPPLQPQPYTGYASAPVAMPSPYHGTEKAMHVHNNSQDIALTPMSTDGRSQTKDGYMRVEN